MKKTFCDRCGQEIKEERPALFRLKIAFARRKKERYHETDNEICESCQKSLEHWWQEARDLPYWRLMQPTEDIVKGLEWILKDDRFGFGRNWNSPEETETEEELAGYYIERALAKLKETQAYEDDRK